VKIVVIYSLFSFVNMYQQMIIKPFFFINIYKQMIIDPHEIYPERHLSTSRDTKTQPTVILESSKVLM